MRWFKWAAKVLLNAVRSASSTYSTLVASPWGFTDGDTTVTITDKDTLNVAVSGAVWTAAVTTTAVSASESDVSVSPATLANDGTTASTITIVVKNADGTPLPGIPAASVVVAVSGSGNTVTQPAAATDQNGATTASVVSTIAATKTVTVTVAGLQLTDQPTIVFSGVALSCPTVNEFWNSSEVAMTGSVPTDSNIIFADDFCRGWWYKADAEGKAGEGRATTVFTGSADASGNLQYTAGWFAGIYGETIPYPAGIVGVDITSTGRTASYAADHGFRDYVGGNYMAAHDLSEGTDKFWARFDCYFESGYQFGAEKIISVNPPNWGGNGGITWGGLGINVGSPAASTGRFAFSKSDLGNYWAETYPGSGVAYTVTGGKWYSVQLYLDRSGADGSHIVRIWIDDLGADGSTIPGGGTPTLRVEETDLTLSPIGGGGHTQFGSLWFENWANAASDGRWYFTNVVVKKASGPILVR